MVISSRRQHNVDETVAALKAEGLDVVGCVCHAGNPDHIKRLVKVRAILFPGHGDVRQHGACHSIVPAQRSDHGAGRNLWSGDLRALLCFAATDLPSAGRSGCVRHSDTRACQQRRREPGRRANPADGRRGHRKNSGHQRQERDLAGSGGRSTHVTGLLCCSSSTPSPRHDTLPLQTLSQSPSLQQL